MPVFLDCRDDALAPETSELEGVGALVVDDRCMARANFRVEVDEHRELAIVPLVSSRPSANNRPVRHQLP